MTHTTGVLAWSLPAGIATSDVGFISFWTLVSALVIGLIGVITLRVTAARSVRFMLTGVVLVSVATSMAGVAVIAYRMLPGVNQDVVLDLMAIAGLAGRSIRVMISGVVLVSVATSMAGVAVIAYRMLPGVDQDLSLIHISEPTRRS